MQPVRRRVEEVAGVLGVTPAVILTTCRDLGIGVASAQSVLDAREVAALQERLGSRDARPGPATPRAVRQRRAGGSALGASALQRVFQALARHRDNATPVQGRVTAVVKGGLLVEVAVRGFMDAGVRGFMPASQVDAQRVEDLDAFVGQDVTAAVIELDAARKSVVLSRRQVVESHRAERELALREALAPGDECDAAVLKVTDRGLVACVDDALEIWIPADEVTRSERPFKAGEWVRLTVCDITENKVLGSLRLASDLNEPDCASVDPELVEQVAGDLGGQLQLRDGQLTVVIEEDVQVEEILQAALAGARSVDAETLRVLVVGSAKGRVRAALQTGTLGGVHPRRSRQVRDGFELVLTRDV